METSTEADILSRRRAYADHLIACIDTVTLTRVEEVEELHRLAAAGEFDADLDWRSPHLK